MSELESGQRGEDITTRPGDDNSGGTGDQQSSSPDLRTTVRDMFEKGELDDLLDKRLQSQKDRRFQKIENQLTDQGTQLERIEQLVNQGVPFAQAKSTVENQDRMAWIDQQREAHEQSLRQQAQGSASSVSGVLKSVFAGFGLDASDPAIAEFMSKNTGQDAVEKAVKFANELNAQRSTASAATISAPARGTPAYRDLRAQYDAEIRAAGRGNVMKISQIKSKYIRLGLDVS